MKPPPHIEMAVVSSNEDDSLTLHLTVDGKSKDMTMKRKAAVSFVQRLVKELSNVGSSRHG